MFYRITADLNFKAQVDSKAIAKVIENLFSRCITINPAQPTEEKSRAVYQICFHDEVNPQPCTLIKELTSS